MLVYTIFQKCWAHPLLQDSKTLQLKWSKKRFEEGPVALWDFFESNGMKMHCTPGTGGARPRNRERKRVAEQSGKNRAGERPAGAAACVRERERERVGWVAREDLRPALLPGPLSRQRRRGGSSGGRAVEKGGEGDFRSLAL